MINMVMQNLQPQFNTNQPSTSQSSMGDMSDYGDSGTYGDEQQELLRLQLDVSDVLIDFEHRVLRGQHEVIDIKTSTKKWEQVSPDSPPILNELGVREVMARLIGSVSKIARLTYKTEEEIYKDMFYADMSLAELIAKRAHMWKMDIETAKSLKDSCIELIWNTVSASRNGFTAINMRSQYSKSDVTRTDSQNKEGKSFLGLSLGRGR
jgi:hypothetical protein